MVAALAAAIAIGGVPQDAVVEATGAGGAAFTYARPTASEDGRPVPVSCVPGPGSRFALGRTVVTCAAVDAAGNRASASFQVTVEDTTPPTLRLPRPIAVDATSPLGAHVRWKARATDAVDGTTDVSCSNTSGERFPIGRTPVLCVTSDDHGNGSLGSFVVTVRGAALQLRTAIAAAPAAAATQLRRAAAALRRGARASCIHLRAYARLVRARPRLLVDARRIESVLGC